QRLVASLPESRLHIEPLAEPMPARAEAPKESVPSDERVAPPEQPEHGEARPAVEHAVATPQPSWSKRVAGGDFRGVLAEARSRGLGETLAQAPLSDLVALGDAARYTSHLDLARD